jgi:copper chaperone CopZ/uncharacterized membrane protein YphA (DoxX/SURF4 family)
MTKTYQLTGMTCVACEYKVRHVLAQVPKVINVEVSKESNTAILEIESDVELGQLQAALEAASDKYNISEIKAKAVHMSKAEAKTWLETYKPILLIFAYIIIVTLLIQYYKGRFEFMEWMRHFMAGFFLVFSFFKLLNLKGFADSYQMYDVIAKKIPTWAYVYVFLELGLGIANLINFNPILTSWITLIIMSVSIIGVLQTVLNKKKIQCACLGAVFNLPMSTVTIIEDGLMIAMSIAMLVLM